jgi:hypothetical protein
MLMDPKTRIKSPALTLWLTAGIGLLLLAYGGVCLVIGAGVDDAMTRALDRFPENGTGALISVARSADFPLKDRNRAVWALGQLGNVRALAPLESLRTGKPCDHAVAVCQRELKKAIRQCRGGVNITRWAWRKFVL